MTRKTVGRSAVTNQDLGGAAQRFGVTTACLPPDVAPIPNGFAEFEVIEHMSMVRRDGETARRRIRPGAFAMPV
jgi:hypothetical protein